VRSVHRPDRAGRYVTPRTRLPAQTATTMLAPVSPTRALLTTLLLVVASACDDPPPGDLITEPGTLPLEQLEARRIQSLCGLLFSCTGVGAEDRLLFGDRAQCEAFLRDNRTFALDDLRRGVAAGAIRYDGAAAQRCLDGLGDCSQLPLSAATQPAACRAVFVGTVAVDGACQRSEECSGDSYCATSTSTTGSCPGTCKPRKAVGSTCVADAQCQQQGLRGVGTCVFDEASGTQAICRDVTRGAPGAEGARCGLDVQTFVQAGCATGLYCNRGTDTCQRPIADGMPCTGNGDRCAGAAACVAGATPEQRSCQALTLRREAGQSCDDRVLYCSPLDGLECDGSACAATRATAGPEGAACARSDYAAACDPGLYCGSARTCQRQLALGEVCDESDACADGSCVDDRCRARDCRVYD
jgi:hypothetical protein